MRKIAIVMLVMAFVLSVVAPMAAMAQDQPQAPKQDAAHRAVKGTFQTVGEAAKGSTETAVSPLVAFWKAITGQDKAEKVVTDPVEKGGKTVYDASKNTAETVSGKNQ